MGSQWAARPWWAAWPVCLVRAAAPTGSWSQGSGRDRGWVSNQQKDGEEQEERGDLAPAPAASPCSVARVCREGQTQWLPLAMSVGSRGCCGSTSVTCCVSFSKMLNISELQVLTHKMGIPSDCSINSDCCCC